MLIKDYQARTKKKAEAALVPDRATLIRDWNGFAPKGNFRADDAADVIAKYWIFSWSFGGGIIPDKISPEHLEAVKRQVHELFQTDPTLSKLTEGQCQALAENLMRIEYASMVQLYLLAGEKKEFGRAIDRIVKQFNWMFGVDLLTLALTQNQGFVVRK